MGWIVVFIDFGRSLGVFIFYKGVWIIEMSVEVVLFRGCLRKSF